MTIPTAERAIMAAALPVIDAVPASQDDCWPGDVDHDDICQVTDHAAALAAVAATEGLQWEFYSWSRTARAFRQILDDTLCGSYRSPLIRRALPPPRCR